MQQWGGRTLGAWGWVMGVMSNLNLWVCETGQIEGRRVPRLQEGNFVLEGFRGNKKTVYLPGGRRALQKIGFQPDRKRFPKQKAPCEYYKYKRETRNTRPKDASTQRH